LITKPAQTSLLRAVKPAKEYATTHGLLARDALAQHNTKLLCMMRCCLLSSHPTTQRSNVRLHVEVPCQSLPQCSAEAEYLPWWLAEPCHAYATTNSTHMQHLRLSNIAD
jgi:hypothetical protein